MFHLVRWGVLAQTIFALWEFGSRSNRIDDPWCRVNYFDRRITAVKNSLELKVSFWLWLEYKHCKIWVGQGGDGGVGEGDANQTIQHANDQYTGLFEGR